MYLTTYDVLRADVLPATRGAATTMSLDRRNQAGPGRRSTAVHTEVIDGLSETAMDELISLEEWLMLTRRHRSGRMEFHHNRRFRSLCG